MNYIKLINAFYDRLETNSLSTSAIALWHALVHVNNKAGWQREFTVAVSVLCVKTGLSERTVSNARNDLKIKGYLDFKSRKGSKSAVYWLNDLSATIADKVTYKEELQAIDADKPSDNVSDKPSDNVSDKPSALIKLNETKLNETKTAAAVSINFYDTYHICFNRPPTPIQVEEINSFIDQEGLSDDLVCEAFKKASANGAGYPYARSIINSWAKKGIKTIGDMEKEQENFEALKQQRTKRKGYAPTRKEQLPGWFDENDENIKKAFELKQEQNITESDFEQRRRALEEKMKKLRS